MIGGMCRHERCDGWGVHAVARRAHPAHPCSCRCDGWGGWCVHAGVPGGPTLLVQVVLNAGQQLRLRPLHLQPQLGKLALQLRNLWREGGRGGRERRKEGGRERGEGGRGGGEGGRGGGREGEAGREREN